MQQEPDADLIDQLIAGSPFIRFMGLELVSLDATIGEVAMKMPIRPEFERGGPMNGQFHGGPIAALIDTVGDFAVEDLAVFFRGLVQVIALARHAKNIPRGNCALG